MDCLNPTPTDPCNVIDFLAARKRRDALTLTEQSFARFEHAIHLAMEAGDPEAEALLRGRRPAHAECLDWHTALLREQLAIAYPIDGTPAAPALHRREERVPHG